jgi:hypothetical protein
MKTLIHEVVAWKKRSNGYEKNSMRGYGISQYFLIYLFWYMYRHFGKYYEISYLTAATSKDV